MRFVPDSRILLMMAALAASTLGAEAATAPKKPVKPVAAAAPVIEPQPDVNILIAQSRDAQNRGEGELALRLAQSAIVADPARPSSYDALGDIYAANNAPEYARDYYQTALSIDPTDMAAQKAIAALDRSANDKRSANAEGAKPGIP